MKLNANDEFVLMVFCVFDKFASFHVFSAFCLSFFYCLALYCNFLLIFTIKPFYMKFGSQWFTFALHHFAFCYLFITRTIL